MIYVGIDVAKDKHDCFLINSDGEVLYDVFTIPNTLAGFLDLHQKIESVLTVPQEIKIGLEATGHFSNNLLGFLVKKGLPTYLINPLHTNLFRKSISLRRTKTDRVDARTIALLLMSDVELKPYSPALYHSEELKSLTRYRFDKVHARAKQRQVVSRIITVLFPELESQVSSVHLKSIYAMLTEFPSKEHISTANLTRLTNLLRSNSHNRLGKESAIRIRDAARSSIGTINMAKSLELVHSIRLIEELDQEILEIEAEINRIMDEINTPLLSVPGLGRNTVASILGEIGDFSKFSTPDKILAFAGMSPSTYQSGKMISSHARMEKRGSRYLRYALFIAAEHVCRNEPSFAAYLAKKRAEGKHYYVAISHAAKKLVRLIYHLEKTGEQFTQAA